MPTKTVKYVNPKLREFTTKYGPSAAVKVTFDDATMGDVLTKPDSAQKHIDALTALIGIPSNFELEDNGEYNGILQFKVKGYPGRPGGEQQGGGGGRQFVVAWANTEDGEKYVQERTDRRSAVMSASNACGPTGTVDFDLAESIYEFLRHTVSDSPKSAHPTRTPSPPQTRQESQQDAQEEGYSDTGHERSRPNGSTADRVEEAARRDGMGFVKGWMIHHGLQGTDVGLRRYICGCAVGRDLETCKDLTGDEWARIKKYCAPLETENVLNLVSHYEQREAVGTGVGD